MRHSASETGSCFEDEKPRLAVYKSHPAVTDRYCLYFSLCGTNGGFYYEKNRNKTAF